MDSEHEAPFGSILLTVGDPCGVGPEVVHSALTRHRLKIERDVIVLGDVVPFANALGDNAEMHHYHIVPFDDFSRDAELLREEFQRLDAGTSRPIFVDLGSDAEGLTVGQGSAKSGELAIGALDAAIELISAGVSDVLVTGPISKRWVHEAGFEFPGHTELLASEFSADPLMVLAGGGLRVALMTIHEPLAIVPLLVRKDGLRASITSFHRSLQKDFGFRDPRIGVCGLNPHAGEGGKFGREEIDTIAPVIQEMASKGMRVSGPHPADSVYPRALRGEFDGVLAMYHDQGLIPVKVLAFDSAVNFTANLPIVRTSPDHGTAFDIAGRGVADSGSMRAALELADRIATRRHASRAGIEPTPTEVVARRI